MYECNPTLVPMDLNAKISKGDSEEDTDATKYRSLLGRLRYLLQTRVDLAYSIGIASRYMQTPKKSHMAAIKQTLRYVKGTIGYGIRYSSYNLTNLVRYCDSSHKIDQDDERCTARWIFYFRELITWCS